MRTLKERLEPAFDSTPRLEQEPGPGLELRKHVGRDVEDRVANGILITALLQVCPTLGTGDPLL